MGKKIDDLEKVVFHTIRYISRLKEEKRSSPGKSPQGKDTDIAGENRIRELTEENSRLMTERKEARRRIRTVLREIDKVK
jgi:regulator of replication initiation timing